jgi:hypothetical protein
MASPQWTKSSPVLTTIVSVSGSSTRIGRGLAAPPTPRTGRRPSETARSVRHGRLRAAYKSSSGGRTSSVRCARSVESAVRGHGPRSGALRLAQRREIRRRRNLIRNAVMVCSRRMPRQIGGSPLVPTPAGPRGQWRRDASQTKGPTERVAEDHAHVFPLRSRSAARAPRSGPIHRERNGPGALPVASPAAGVRASTPPFAQTTRVDSNDEHPGPQARNFRRFSEDQLHDVRPCRLRRRDRWPSGTPRAPRSTNRPSARYDLGRDHDVTSPELSEIPLRSRESRISAARSSPDPTSGKSRRAVRVSRSPSPDRAVRHFNP